MENLQRRGRGRPRKGAVRRARTVDLPINVDQAVVDLAAESGLPLTDTIASLVAQGLGLDEPDYIREQRSHQRGLKMGA